MTTDSSSRLGRCNGCPRKYYYQHVAKIKPEELPEGSESFFGRRAHDVKQEHTPGDYR